MTATKSASSRVASERIHAEIRMFLDQEAELIDSRRFAEWLDLVTKDFTYRMPVPYTPDNPVRPHYDPDALIINETRDTLIKHWFRRYDPDMWEMAWAENPPVRYRHLITNVRVRETDAVNLYDVRSNVIVSATRQSDQPTLLVVERFDKIVRGGDDWRLRDRFVVTDATVIAFAQLRVVL
jgi:3-phenylpropionate/trans-cinnamate dioxygenase subunit beta